MAGRTTKLTAAISKRICDAVAKGYTYDLAAAAGGVTYESLRTWRHKGEAGIRPYAAFAAALKRAETECLDRMLGVIQRAAIGEGEWTAAAWLLERRYPRAYGRKTVEVTGPDGGPIQHEDVSADAAREELVQRFVRLAGVARAEDERGGPGSATGANGRRN